LPPGIPSGIFSDPVEGPLPTGGKVSHGGIW
jgi:hypothetical protein